MNKSKIVNAGNSKYLTVNPKYWVDLTPDSGSGSGNNKRGFTDMSYFCYKGHRVDELPMIDTSNGTDFSYMFSGGSNLIEVSSINTSNGTNFNSMFNGCRNLTEIPELDTSNGTDFGSMFFSCSNLTEIPELDTSNGTDFSYMFNGCSNLTTIPKLDTSNGTNFGSMFYYCSKLTNLRLYNIRWSVEIGYGTIFGHLLTVDSLVHTIKELCKAETQQTLTMGSANLEKISGLYCKVLDDTTEKIDMELCESTDEGAMTLSEYAALKNWIFK